MRAVVFGRYVDVPAVPCVSRITLARVPLAPGVRMIVSTCSAVSTTGVGDWKRTSVRSFEPVTVT